MSGTYLALTKSLLDERLIDSLKEDIKIIDTVAISKY